MELFVASIPHSEQKVAISIDKMETLHSIQNLLSTALHHKEASTVSGEFGCADYKKAAR